MNKPILNIKDSYKMHIIDQYKDVGGIPRDGLIGEWLFSGNADDTSGNGNDGTLSGTTPPILTTGKDGGVDKAYEFENKNYITFGDPAILQNIHSSDFSLSLWLNDYTGGISSLLRPYWSSWNGNRGVLFRNVKGTVNTRFRADIQFSTTNMIFESNDCIITSTWTHVVCVFNFTTKTIKLYIDGIEKTFFSQTSGVGNPISDIGTDKQMGLLSIPNQIQFYRGKLSLVRLYNRELTQEGITALYNE